ncbi:hypothetical protein L873DRAFT_1842538 [Choiromyces venosus 120613-1]|uniref:PA domain-containing protein n=1 Tax=Choiromyces venosus 120613-1 TaxID=1336337 RepID=A0A3N4JS43_9PEZI|nr:hypothetical protein L873DRAFT_1842538 [Choiromyces venosus 120613-1]
MKGFLAASLLLTISSALPSSGRELVQSNKLRRVLYRSKLLEGGNLLQKFAYDTPERNRGFGGVDAIANGQADFPALGPIAIALVTLGTCPYLTKVSLAFKASAKAVLIVNTANTPATSRLTPDTGLAPTAGASNSLGQEIISKINGGANVTATLDLQYLAEKRVTHNVIAPTKYGDPNNVVMIGAHTDSVPEGLTLP